MNATVEQSLISKIKALSPQHVAEVEDFVEFLAAKSKRRAALDRLLTIVPALEAAGVEPMTEDEIAAEEFVTDDPLFGMRRDREDMVSVAGYVRSIRASRFNDDGAMRTKDGCADADRLGRKRQDLTHRLLMATDLTNPPRLWPHFHCPNESTSVRLKSKQNQRLGVTALFGCGRSSLEAA